MTESPKPDRPPPPPPPYPVMASRQPALSNPMISYSSIVRPRVDAITGVPRAEGAHLAKASAAFIVLVASGSLLGIVIWFVLPSEIGNMYGACTTPRSP